MEISFSEKGKGFPLVLLPGFCEIWQLWNDFVDDLARNFWVLTPDLPGFGNSPLPETDFSIADIGESVFYWFQQLHINSEIVGSRQEQ